ncbi:hypothetical protein [Microbulbifer aggregans]|uniref:hypothetical protein n=1 Tax=Microbulbifer aggregans TaxID=1769779 RepID=UPI001CFCDB9E|nr:hypothetical protein [Microbulbifer aggregans]
MKIFATISPGKFTYSCALLSLVFCGALAAQNAAETSDDAAVEKEAVSAQPVAVGTTQQQKQKKSTPKIKAQSAENADSYEASEEISEDLSVSYPVDI